MDIFNLRTKILIGGRAFREMIRDKKRVFIVTDAYLEQKGSVSYITDMLDSFGIAWTVYSHVAPDPDIDMVAAGVSAFLNFAPDAVVAFGGGSPIDAAKAIVYFAARQYEMQGCSFVAVPTTSGTGSEVSRFAVITDKKRGVKYPLIDDVLLPEYALLDAELTRTLPPSVTADTGMDVMTHAIEAYVSTESNTFTDALAEKAVQLVYENLLIAYREPDNMTARQNMHNASCMAGAAFSNSGLGLCHGMAHAVGARAHIPHGMANAILLPYVMVFNAGCETSLTQSAERYAQLAAHIGLKADSVRQSAINLIRSVRQLNKHMNIPRTLKEAGITEEQFDAMLDPMAQAALDDRCTPTNPRKCAKEEVKSIYRQAFVGSTHIMLR